MVLAVGPGPAPPHTWVADLKANRSGFAAVGVLLEGEVVELAPSRTKPQGVARVKWTAYNQHGEAVYTFNPIAIVPSRPT